MIRVGIIPKGESNVKVVAGFDAVPRQGDEISFNGVLALVEFVRWTEREGGGFQATAYLDRPAPVAS